MTPNFLLFCIQYWVSYWYIYNQISNKVHKQIFVEKRITLVQRLINAIQNCWTLYDMIIKYKQICFHIAYNVLVGHKELFEYRTVSVKNLRWRKSDRYTFLCVFVFVYWIFFFYFWFYIIRHICRNHYFTQRKQKPFESINQQQLIRWLI